MARPLLRALCSCLLGCSGNVGPGAAADAGPPPDAGASPDAASSADGDPGPDAIDDTAAPTVAITAPATGTVYTFPEDVRIEATAADDRGVTRVEFWDGATLVATYTDPPYAHTWRVDESQNDGGTPHPWTARAHDAAGHVGVSAVVALTVSIGPLRYLSPAGLDSNPGTETAPWRTFAHALPQLQPGFTLVLLDGVYEPATTGLPHVSCGAAGQPPDGTPSAPITLRAASERGAHLRSDGATAALRLHGCSYWQLVGLRGSSADAAAAGDPPHVFDIDSSDHVVARRLLAHHANRRANAHLLAVDYSSDVLVEECEVYWYHRWGIVAYESDRVTLRRDYANSRGYADLPDGYASITPDRGDFGIGLYQGQTGTRRSTVENCVSEDNGADFRSGRNPTPSGSAEPNADWNRFLGCIAIGDGNGMVRDYTGGADTDPGLAVSYDTIYENVVVVGSAHHGVYLRGGRNLLVRNATLFGSGNDGFLADNVHDITEPSVHLVNVLAFGNAWTGLDVSADFLASTGASWSIEHSNTDDGYAPAEPIDDDAGGIRRSTSVTPARMGLTGTQCIVYVPADETALKGTGKDGADVGANVVYRYRDGALTADRLWGPEGFPCGAVVPGVNDVPGSSCRDVHERLNLGPGRCPIP